MSGELSVRKNIIFIIPVKNRHVIIVINLRMFGRYRIRDKL